MDSTSSTRRPPRQLPALTPAPFRSSSSPAAAPHKLEQLQRLEPRHHSSGASRSGALPLRTTSSSIAHVFFNRRPLDLIRRTTSSVLTQSDESAHSSARTAVGATSAVSDDDRPLRPPCRLHSSEPTGRRRRQPLHCTDNNRSTDELRPHLPRRLQLTGAGSDAQGEPEERPSCSKDVAERRKLSAMCPPTGTEVLRDTEKAAELTLQERVEIQQYDEVYFVSTRAVKRARCQGRIRNLLPVHGDDRAVVEEDEPSAGPTPLCNDGYDDKDGNYLVLIGDHLAFRYEVQSALGHGAFGQVVRCVDRRTCKQVAVKIIGNRPAHRDQALMEVQVLTQLERAAARDEEQQQHAVVRMKDHFHFRDHVCLVFDVLGMDLYRYLSLRSFRGLSMTSVRTVGDQLARALTFLRQQKVVHCDLKPENILLDAPVKANDARTAETVDHVTLIDFGSSCLAGAPMATYIQSRFYRSPEVLLGHACSDAIDMWSLACILVELLTGHPMFAGENDREQFACIVEVLDVPPVDMVLQAERRLTFFEQVSTPVDGEAAEYVLKPFANSRGRRRVPGSRSLASAARTDDSDFLSFLARCFVWDPRQRLTAEQALEEPWMQR